MSEEELEFVAGTIEEAARPAEADEIPSGAKSIAKLAEANGWDVRITYARGEWMAGTHHARTRESIAVRMHRGGEWRLGEGEVLVGIWLDGKFHSGLTPNPLARLNTKELRTALKEAP